MNTIKRILLVVVLLYLIVCFIAILAPIDTSREQVWNVLYLVLKMLVK